MVGKTGATPSKSPGGSDSSKVPTKPRALNASPTEPKVPAGPRVIKRAGAMLEKKPPTDRPTIGKVPPRPKPAPGGGHAKDEPQEGAGSKAGKDSPDRGKGGLLSDKRGTEWDEDGNRRSSNPRESKFDPRMLENLHEHDMPRRP